ncbi:MAG TPA: S41 family peptidase [Tepidisphaeraceae bacterium]|nr:S41 family peptidase [Tepidisphaeraceae bacterium]
MKRERIAWMLSFVLLCILAFNLPGSWGQRDDDYSFVRTLVDIHRQIDTNYVEPVNDSDLRLKAINGMMSDLDPFSIYIPPDEQADFDRMLQGSFKGVGIELDLEGGHPVVVTPIDGSPAFYAGVMAGDVILKVNGDSVDGLDLESLVKKIAGPVGAPVTLTLRHVNGRVVTLTMKREEIVQTTVKGYQRNSDDTWDYYVCKNPKIAYLRITQFTDNTFDELHDALVGHAAEPAHDGQAAEPAEPGIMDTGMKGLILDLRFNPGGELEQAVKVVNLFVKSGVIVSTRGRNRPEQVFSADGQGTLPYFPMIVLVNEHSASAAEIVSGSLKDHDRALIVGTRTYGKGSVQELIPLDDDSGELKLTVAYYYLPSGRLVHRRPGATDWGVNPQIVVPMDDQQEEQVMELHVRQETIRRPTTQPIEAAATAPTTQPIDPQLQQALNTMVGLIVLQRGQAPAPLPPVSAN